MDAEMDQVVSDLVTEIAPLVEYINELAERVLPEYRLFASRVERGIITDLNKIEYQLDYMLDFCHNDKVLVQFKRVMRYLWQQGHYETVSSYVHAYGRMWDENYPVDEEW